MSTKPQPSDSLRTGGSAATEPDVEETAWEPGRVEAVGAYAYIVLTERARRLPPKRFGFGFQVETNT